METTIQAIRRQLTQLQELHDSGVLARAQYEEGKTKLERRLLDLVLAQPESLAEPVAPAPAQALPVAAPAGHAARQTPESVPPSAPAARTRRVSKALLASLLLGVLAIAGAGYWWTGGAAQMRLAQAQQAGADPAGDARADAAGGPAGARHDVSMEQIAAMADKLAARLKEQPKDGAGWAMLARTYNVMQRPKDAQPAYEKAIALQPDDAALLADYADTLAVNHGGSLEGEPMKQVARALKLEPKNLKALALAGSYAFNKKDYKGAVQYWTTLVQSGPADNLFVKQLTPGLVEARRLAGLPADPTLAAAPPPPAAPLDMPAPGAASKPTISGSVRLAPSLAKQVQPGDTVFVFARAEGGARMPLAILRKQVKDLPFQFTLDDSLAMSPANALSSASSVIVGARVSKSGNAMPQPGDFAGQSAPVRVGSADVQIEIRDPVKP